MTEPSPIVVPFKGLRPAPSATLPRDQRPGIAGLTADELSAWFVERGEPAFRGRQVLLDGVWGSKHAAFDELTTLPAATKAALEAAFRFDTVEDSEVRYTDGVLTEKALHRLSDGLLIESVLMHYPARPAAASATPCASAHRPGAR